MRKTKLNRFYVGAEGIAEEWDAGNNARWTQPSFEAAARHAKDLLESEPDRDCCLIVQIVGVVRRQRQPMIVERVRG